MQVSIHLIGPPAPDHAQAVAIDAGTQKGHHGAAGPSRADGYVRHGVGRIGVEDDRGADALSEIRRRDESEWSLGAGANGVQGSERRGTRGAEGLQPRCHHENGAKMGVTRAAVADEFVTDPILLFREGEGNESGGQEFGVGALKRVQRARSNPELDIANAELGSQQRGWGWLPQVFPRAQQEEKSESQHLGGGDGGRGRIRVRRGPDLGEHR